MKRPAYISLGLSRRALLAGDLWFSTSNTVSWKLEAFCEALSVLASQTEIVSIILFEKKKLQNKSCRLIDSLSWISSNSELLLIVLCTLVQTSYVMFFSFYFFFLGGGAWEEGWDGGNLLRTKLQAANIQLYYVIIRYNNNANNVAERCFASMQAVITMGNYWLLYYARRNITPFWSVSLYNVTEQISNQPHTTWV